MSEDFSIPPGWAFALLKDVAKKIVDGSHNPPPKQETGFPMLSARNVACAAIDFSEFRYITKDAFETERKRADLQPDDVLLTIVGTIGRAAVIPQTTQQFALQRSVAMIRPDGLDSRFCMFQLLSERVQKWLRDQARGSAQQGVYLKTLGTLPMLVAPLPEQRRIVAEIEKQFTRLEAGVAALRRVQANLKRYRAAVLKAACEGRLVPTEAKWPQKQIATAIQTIDQGWSPKCESEPSDNNGTWAVIKTTAIQNLRFLQHENKALPMALNPREHLELAPGDLLVTRAGPRSRVGVACLIKSTRPRLMLCDKAYRLRCKPTVANPAFLELALNSPHILDEVNNLKTGMSDSGVNLTQKRFGELLVPLPPVAEQTRIVAEVERRLSVAEELEAVVSANLQRAVRLRQSILQKAFTGSLTEHEMP